jgi:hypothetical protein
VFGIVVIVRVLETVFLYIRVFFIKIHNYGTLLPEIESSPRKYVFGNVVLIDGVIWLEVVKVNGINLSRIS